MPLYLRLGLLLVTSLVFVCASCGGGDQTLLTPPRLSLLEAPLLTATGLKSTAGAPEGIILTWQRVTDPSAVGYFVYRDTVSIPDPLPGENIDPLLRTNAGLLVNNPDSGETVMFSDYFAIVIGQQYFYRITVVDNQDPAQESPPSNEMSWEAHGQTITGFSPAGAFWGDDVTLTGDTFGTYDDTTDQVMFTMVGGGTHAGTVVSWTVDEIVATIPDNTDNGPVFVVIDATIAQTDEDLLIYNPIIDDLDPAIGFVEQQATLTGRNFKPAEASSLLIELAGSNITSSMDTWSETEITLTLPADSIEGDLSIRVNNHPSNPIEFTPRAEILSISPTTVQSGELVLLNGRFFGANTGTVWLNLDQQLTVVNWADDEITVAMTGSTGPAQISVETETGIVSNAYDYLVIGDLEITLSGLDDTTVYSVGGPPPLVVVTPADTERVELIIDGISLAESITYPFDDLELPIPLMTNGSHVVMARAHRRSVSANSNTVSVSVYSLVGDINGDGVVDLTDQLELELLMGMRASNPLFLPWYDTNDDGRITETDLALVGYNFGNTTGP